MGTLSAPLWGWYREPIIIITKNIMLITATTTSQKLSNMLSSAELTSIRERCGSCAPDGRYIVFLQVTGANDIYVDLYQASTSSDGVKVNASTGEMSLQISDLQDINIISVTGDSAVRVIVNK